VKPIVLRKPGWGEAPYVEPGAPPSSYPVAAVLEGEPGGWPAVAWGTVKRSAFIAPGLALAGIRGKQLVLGSVYASLGITAALFALYLARRKRYVEF